MSFWFDLWFWQQDVSFQPIHIAAGDFSKDSFNRRFDLAPHHKAYLQLIVGNHTEQSVKHET